MKTANIVKCSDGQYRAPSRVRLVGNFKDANGRPFVEQLERHVGHYYVSSEYPPDVVQILKDQLSVTEMTSSDFTNALNDMNNRNMFKHWDNEWLEGVCHRIVTYCPYRHARRLPLIQLRNGTWDSCHSCDRYLFGSSSISFPSGLPVQVIDQPSSNTFYRCSILRKLGVHDLNATEIVKQIVNLHLTKTPSFQETLEQVLYVYRQYSPYDRHNLCFIRLYDQYGCARYGKDLYMDDPQDSGPDRLSTLFSNSTSFVNAGLQRPHSVKDLTQWQQWLIAEFGLRTAPRIVEDRPATEFAEVIDRYRLDDMPRLLRLLQKHWLGISSQATNLKSLEAYFGGLEVRCKDGRVVPMRTTFFPSQEILHYGANSLSVLDLGDSDFSKDWAFLGNFGVGMKPDAGFFIQQLIVLAGIPCDKNMQPVVTALYEQIQARSLSSEAAIL